LLCRHHHVLIHEGGWTISGAPRHLRFYRPDGSELGADSPRRPVPSPLSTPSRQRELPPGGLLEVIRSLPRLRGPYPDRPASQPGRIKWLSPNSCHRYPSSRALR
jgi:hypothetical protein